MDAITFQQTPAYRLLEDRTIKQSGSIPAGTELFIKSVSKLNSRDIGLLPTGEFVYMDSISTLLEDKVEVKDKRLWDWLIGIFIVIIILSISIYYATR